jgi:hypothetical protein
VIETHDIGRRLDGYTSTQAAVRRQKAANSKHHATERKKKRKYTLILWLGNISRAISLLTHITHDDTTHASLQKGTRQTHIKIDAAPTPPQSPSHILLNPYRQMRVFLAQADLYTLSYSISLKDIDNFLHTSTLFPFSLKGVKLTDYQPPSSPAAAAAQVDSHTHLSPAAPCNQDNTISRGGKVCRLLSCSYRGGETILCRTVGSLAIIHHRPSTSPSLLS